MNAPVCVSTYIRLKHLRQAIAALQGNRDAEKHELFVLSDGPRAGDEERVADVRRFLRTVKGFKSVTILERATNNRVENNRGGMREILDHYGRLIFLEEDVITAPGMLRFINSGLDLYEKNEKIFSVSAWSPPIDERSVRGVDCFSLMRFNAWGFGIWKNRFELVKDIDGDDWARIKRNKVTLSRWLRQTGADIGAMIEREVRGELDAFDVKAMYWQYKHNMFTVYPAEALARNIGFDGTGTNCGISETFNSELWDRVQFQMDRRPIYSKALVKRNYVFRRPRYWWVPSPLRTGARAAKRLIGRGGKPK